MRGLLLLLLALWPALATAQDLPAAYRVEGVAGDDVLNVRAGPGAGFDKVGELGPYAIHVEVLELSDDGGWGRVSTGEGNGWASMRFLRPEDVPDYEIPRPLTCLGTEPFWRLGLYPRGAEYDAPDTGRRDLHPLRESVARQGYLAEFEEGPTLTRTLIVTREYCSDGMSDRDYGFSARLFTEAPDGNSVERGCCTLDHR